jgi:NAD(P)-dependent dehydrogenase (short-subunit alcohol dehydrogenase family)
MNELFVGIGTGPGMGISTAERFAREGFDLVLTSRDVSKLRPLAEKIRKETGRNVETTSLGIHIATLTVTRLVSPGSGDAHAAAEAFWKLHSEAPDHWNWEATL